MPYRKRRGVDEGRGERERESWWKGKRKDGEWLVVSLADYFSSFFHFLPPFDIPPFPSSLLFRGRKQGAEEKEGLVRGLRFIYLDRTLLFAPRLGTLSSVFFQWPPRMGFPLTVEDRMDPPVAGSSNVYIDRIKFSNRNNCFDNVTYA